MSIKCRRSAWKIFHPPSRLRGALEGGLFPKCAIRAAWQLIIRKKFKLNSLKLSVNNKDCGIIFWEAGYNAVPCEEICQDLALPQEMGGQAGVKEISCVYEKEGIFTGSSGLSVY
jgi:hypothetical protein